jgi:plasmid stabilization system protein ParE
MGSAKRPSLTVTYAETARRQLAEIWNWNSERYGAEHADEYIELLRQTIRKLSAEPDRGQIVDVRPQSRFFLIQKKSKRHGHIAVYEVDQTHLNVLYLFHSAQEWRNKIASDEP